ncbi:hypothetical protein Cni_G05967 [Canna indica]|uniref:ATP-dependent DNA helicase n=1 Tax=Canna indica TaxID=4628 RepID=A0AAQ3JXT2_9LILI|nr:hypothetical protein Cni_G05967 [Canna indica]
MPSQPWPIRDPNGQRSQTRRICNCILCRSKKPFFSSVRHSLKDILMFDIDKIISAQIPYAELDPVGYKSVMQFMVHGPCGQMNMTAPLSFLTFKIDYLQKSLTTTLNVEQKEIHDAVVDSVMTNSGKFFFVYGYGGTRKTHLWTTIISGIRSKGLIVLAVASSGIASLLLPGGRIAHSRFKIPLNIDGNSTCQIKQKTQLAELIQTTTLIVWDEVPMNHRHCFEALNRTRTLQDLMYSKDSLAKDKLFGGKTLILAGDFHQILPVVENDTKSDAIDAWITKSPFMKTLSSLQIGNQYEIVTNRNNRG